MSSLAEIAKRVQPRGYLLETEKIKENKKTYEGTVHKFTAAKWTHPNGHPRCLLCGDEQPISPECGRDATPEEKKAFHESLKMEFSKANITWDGDGVQGAGQPRDRMGRWVRLPGTSALKKVGAWELDDGSFGVFKDDEEEPYKTFKTKRSANREVARKIKDDAEAYWRDRVAPKQRREHARRQKEMSEKEKQQVAEQASRRAKSPVPEKGRAARKPPRNPREDLGVVVRESERAPAPGRPNAQQAKDANAFARREFDESEAKYAELVIRLLKNKGITQDPSKRGDIKDRYGISPKRQAEIESAVYSQMFPKSGRPKRGPNLQGVPQITEQQRRGIAQHGGRKAYPIPDPENPREPERLFKSNKGEHRGKWLRVSWNGTVSEVSDIEAIDAMVEAKFYYAERMLRDKNRMNAMREKRRQQQADLLEAYENNRRAIKQQKILAAKRWAISEGLDPDDSFWWGFYWNDSSLVLGTKEQNETESTHRMEIKLAPVMESEKMDPRLLEGLLALPDEFDARRMRGHRPGPRRPIKGDEDFVEARSSGSDAFENAERKRRRREAREARRNVTKSQPLWDGDGVQGQGQPRGKGGRWTKHRGSALSSVMAGMDFGDSESRRHRVSSTPKKSGGKVSVFDTKRKRITEEAEKALKPLPHKGLDRPLGPDGKPIAKKNIPWQEALYLRNNGPTKITNARLAEIYNDRSKITPQERDLLMSAGARMSIDGGKEEVRVYVVRSRQHQLKARYFVMNTLRKEIANDLHRKSGGERGQKGHIVRRVEVTEASRLRENKKRVASGRNKVNMAMRVQIANDFKSKDGKVKCIFCGRNVDRIENISPERMKPGLIGGKYERGNVAPSHERCNTKVGTFAQHRPDEYYDQMMEKFLKTYKKEIAEGNLKFVFAKNRGKLGAAPK